MMARRARVFVEGGLYQVENRVANGERVFTDTCDAMEFVQTIREIKERDRWKVLAWCAMSSHFHVVLRVSAVPLWRGMYGIQNRFSREFSRRYGLCCGKNESARFARLDDGRSFRLREIEQQIGDG